MVFRKCLVGSSDVYGTGTTEAGRMGRKKERIERRRKRAIEARRSEQQGGGGGEGDEPESKEAQPSDSDRSDDDESSSVVDASSSSDLRIPHVEFNQVSRVCRALSGLEPVSQRLSQLAQSTTPLRPEELLQLFMYGLSLNNSVFPKIRRAGDTSDVGDDDDGDTSDLEEVGVGGGETFRPGVDVAHIEAAAEAAEYARRDQDQYLIGNEPVSLESSSPDERALVAFAQVFGFELLRRSGGKVELRLQQLDESGVHRIADTHHPKHRSVGPPDCDEDEDEDEEPIPEPLKDGTFQIERFDEICLLDFTAKRKRMTVILQPILPSGEKSDYVLIFMKGADSSLKPFLQDGISPEDWSSVFRVLGRFGSESLRTLLLGWSIQPAHWWEESGLKQEWQQVHRDAGGENEKGHVEGVCSDACQVCAIENKIESACRLRLLGATAIEDKLADNVPAVLEDLSEAGIKIWMLSGDNLSTGTNIAISCNLFDSDMYEHGRLFSFDRELDSIELIEAQVYTCLTRVRTTLQSFHRSASRDDDEPLPVFGLAFHGDVWKLLHEEHRQWKKLKAEEQQQKMKDPSSSSSSSVAASSVLDRFFELAALYTPMIKQADIGVGIRGVEGTSAVASSDYAISSFKYLKRLLLVHGRYNYRRIATLILYVFYKSSFLVFTLFWFGAYSQFSGTFLYLDWAVQLHNVCYTAMPILVYAVFDRDLNVETLEKNPHIYSLTRGPVLFSIGIFAQWMMIAFLQAAICYFIPFTAFDHMTSPAPDGSTFGLWSSGLCVYVCVVLTTNLRLVWEFQSWTIYHHLSLWGSIVVFVSAMCIFSSSPKFAIGGADYYGVFFRLLALARFWFVVIVTVSSCMMVDLAHRHFQRTFFDSPTWSLIEAERTKGPEAVKALARKLHRHQQATEQEALFASYAKSRSRRPSVAAAGATTHSSWDNGDEPPMSPQAQKNALLNRRGRAAPKSARTHVRSDESDYYSESESPAPLPSSSASSDVKPPMLRQASYTGSNFVFTPRGAFNEAHASEIEPSAWPVQIIPEHFQPQTESAASASATSSGQTSTSQTSKIDEE